MKKKTMIGAGVLSLCLAMGSAMGSNADSRKVVTLGADLTDQQRQMVMNYFGVTADQVDILTINNQDERDHLGAFVPLEQIGTRTYSCALVSPTTSGGIQVKTANLDWVTCNMIATTLSTSGVVNCDVIAASPIQVSGTGALTGIIMAYEQASGEELDPQRKELATEELVITGQLADNVGQNQATAIVNEAKTEIISQNITDITVIQNIVNEAAIDNETTLSQDELDMVTELLDKIAQEDYDYDEMKDTLDRVDENVGYSDDEYLDIDSDIVSDEEAAAFEAGQEELQDENVQDETTETEASILDNTNDDAFGENVIMGSTQETEAAGEGYADVPAETEGFQEILTEAIVETETLTESYAGESAETEVPTEVYVEEPADTEMPTEVYVEGPAETEIPAETEAITEAHEPEYTEDDLSEEKKMIYKELNWYLDKVFGRISEHSDSQEYAEISAMTVTELKADPEISNRLKDEMDKFALEMLVEGPENKDMDEADKDEYGVPEVRALYNEIHDLMVSDVNAVLADVEPAVRQTICDEAKTFFRKLYGLEEVLSNENGLTNEEVLPDEGAFPDENVPDEGEIPEAAADGAAEG